MGISRCRHIAALHLGWDPRQSDRVCLDRDCRRFRKPSKVRIALADETWWVLRRIGGQQAATETLPMESAADCKKQFRWSAVDVFIDDVTTPSEHLLRRPATNGGTASDGYNG